MLRIFDSLIVPSTSCFYDIIMIFGVSFKCDFTVTIGTFEVESKDFDAKIGLLVTNLHSHVKFGSKIKIVSTSIAT